MFKDIVDAMREEFWTCLKEIKYLSERVEAVEKKVGITTKRKGTSAQNTTPPPKPTLEPGLGFDWASRLVHYMLGFQLYIKKNYELWSLVGPEPVMCSLLEFDNLTGLNCECIEDLERPHCVVTKELTSFWEMLGVHVEAGPSTQEIIAAFKRCEGWSQDDRKRLAYLAIFTGYIQGRKYSTPKRVSLARFVMELERFENYPWGRVAFKVLMDFVKGRDISGCYTINGFAQALQVWVYTALPELGATFGNPLPNNPSPPILAYKGRKGRRQFKEAILSQDTYIRGRAPAVTCWMLHTALKKALHDDEYEELMDSKLGVFIKFQELGFDWASRLVHYMLGFLLDIKKKYELWSLVGPEPVRFSLLEFENLTGLNYEYIEDLERPHCVVTKELTSFWEMLGVHVEAGPSTQEIIAAFERCEGWSRDDRKWLAYLSIFTRYIEGKKYSTPTRVSLARLVMELERFENYPWGRVAFKVLMDSVKGRDISGCYTINGFAQALQVWVYIALLELGANYGNPLPNNLSPLILAYKGRKGRRQFKEAILSQDIVDAMREGFGTCLKEIKYLSERVEAVEKKVGITTKQKGISAQNTTPPPKSTLKPGSESVNGTNVGRKSLPEDKAKVIIPKKKLYPGYNPFVPIDKKKLKELADWLKTCPHYRTPLYKKPRTSRTWWYQILQTSLEWLEDCHIDAWINVPRKRYDANPQHFRGERMCFRDYLFAQQWRFNYKDFKDSEPDQNGLGRRLPGGAWNYYAGTIPSFCQSNKVWGTDIDDIYAPVNFADSHWIAIWISIPKRHIVVFDSICSSISPEELDVVMEPFLYMVPYLLVECASSDELRAQYSLEPFTYERPTNIPPVRAGDCGVYTLKYIECHALGIEFSKKDFAKANGKTMEDKMAVDIFQELPDAHEFENKDNDANLGAYEG
ncbi:hypothetical protein F2Q68_00035375 [Brassica cretica]|uniref:Ubiquitin-like protease family profile domain-containing protein n=1 Tax=Brassica cretica TaxID=69181 RepID=A0A8S9H164_BRACR|nr:hypothetical protein F2Q68_00035375 [Brassica cretica]